MGLPDLWMGVSQDETACQQNTPQNLDPMHTGPVRDNYISYKPGNPVLKQSWNHTNLESPNPPKWNHTNLNPPILESTWESWDLFGDSGHAGTALGRGKSDLSLVMASQAKLERKLMDDCWWLLMMLMMLMMAMMMMMMIMMMMINVVVLVVLIAPLLVDWQVFIVDKSCDFFLRRPGSLSFTPSNLDL